MNRTARINIKPPTFKRISHKEWDDMIKSCVTVWHFERTKKGVKPAAGAFDPNNPHHVKKSSVIDMWDNGKHINLGD